MICCSSTLDKKQGESMSPFKRSAQHLNDSQMSYWVHFHHAFRLGFILIYAGLASLIHALCPFLYPAYSAKQVIRIFVNVVLDSLNPEIQNYLKSELSKKHIRIDKELSPST
jgi:hypothetical protein